VGLSGTSPYVDVLVEEHDALPEGCELRFHAVGPARPVHRVLYEPLDGPQGQGEQEFEVRAANADGGESEARAVPVDDSGAGTSVLVYGGVRGLRLYRSGAGHRGANDAAPVAEPYLLLADDAIIG
jgi:hypothetical protein